MSTQSWTHFLFFFFSMGFYTTVACVLDADLRKSPCHTKVEGEIFTNVLGYCPIQKQKCRCAVVFFCCLQSFSGKPSLSLGPVCVSKPRAGSLSCVAYKSR